MNKERLLSSSIMILAIIGALFNKWLFLLLLLALTIGGLYEFFYLIKKKGIPIYSYTGILIGVLIPLTIFFEFELTHTWELLFMVVLLIMIFLLQFLRRDNTNAIVGISTTLFGIIYVSWFFSFLIRIRYLMPGFDGVKLVAFILIITKVGDMGALFIGSMFGKHPLLPRVSPSKTVEGSLGSFVFSIMAALLGGSLLPQNLGLSVVHIALIGAFFGGVGQLGDLSESLIKRDCNVKDSGNILPGLGGILDTIDSILFSAPAFYFYMSSVLKAV